MGLQYLDLYRGPQVEEGGRHGGAARLGGQVQRGVPGHVQLVNLHPLLAHLLAQPARNVVLPYKDDN